MKIIKHLRSDWFRYGFETLAVIVGILIAFALDNWNDERRNEKIEVQYLRRLSIDLKSDTAYFNYRIRKAEKMIIDTRLYVEESYEEQKNVEEFRQLMELIAWDSEQMTVQNTTYIELTNSGFLHLFKNQELKTALIELYKQYEEAEHHIKEFNEVSADGLVDMKNYVTVAKYIVPEVFNKPRMFNDQEWAFINEPESFAFRILEENATVYLFKYIVFLDHFQKLRFENKKLILMISDELSSRD